MRDDKISIMKGIAIILMVVGHSGCPGLLDSFIYLFHMPLFFFVSGWFFKDSYTENKIQFIKKRTLGLYWPFVKYGLIFLVLHNLFYHLYISADYYNTSQLLDRSLQTLSFRGVDPLLGGFWFLKYLFVASMVCLFGVYFLKLINKYINFNKGRITLITMLLCAAFVLSYLNYNASYVVACIIFMLGYIAKEYQEKISMKLIISIPLLIILIAVAYLLPMSMIGASGSLKLILPYLVISTIGIYATMIISHYLTTTKTNKLLVYIGDNTMNILVYHLLALKIVSLVKILQYDLPITSLSDFPIIKEHNTYYWILYSLIGVIIPLVVTHLFKALKRVAVNGFSNKKTAINNKLND